MKATESDKKFEDGEDVLDQFDLETTSRTNREVKRVNVDFPTWMIVSLDKEAVRLGVTRQSLIKLWLADKLESRATI